MIITFANHKGGVGKTTLAMIVAETLIDEKKGADMYDLDSQQNFTEKMTEWILDKDQFAVVNIKHSLDGLSNKKGVYSVIDTAPGLDEATQKAILAADVIVVPVVAESDSIKGLADVLKLNPQGKVFVAHNNYDKNWAFDKKAHEIYVKMVADGAAQGADIYLFTLPRDRFLTANLYAGEDWCVRMSAPLAQPFYDFYDAIIAASEGVKK